MPRLSITRKLCPGRDTRGLCRRTCVSPQLAVGTDRLTQFGDFFHDECQLFLLVLGILHEAYVAHVILGSLHLVFIAACLTLRVAVGWGGHPKFEW